MMDVENPMLIDGYWPDYESDEERETREEIEAKIADDAYDSRWDW